MNDPTVIPECDTPWRQATESDRPDWPNGTTPRETDVSHQRAQHAFLPFPLRGRPLRTRLARSVRALTGVAVLASAVPLASSSAFAQAYHPPVYSQPLNAPPPAAPIAAAPPGAGAALSGEQTAAQVAAYDQYLMDLSVVAGQASSTPSTPPADVGAYFHNGAAVTGVPPAGQPGSAYFTNGAAVTSVPAAGQPGSGYFTNGAADTRLPLSTPATSVAQAQAPLESRSPPPAPEPPPMSFAGSAQTPPAPAAVQTRVDGPPMSFEAWLESMGAAFPEDEASAAAATFGGEPLAFDEPYAEAAGEGTRDTHALPVKAGERDAAREVVRASRESRTARTLRLGAAIIAASFAIGLLLGAVGMWLARIRTAPARVGTSRRSILR